MASDNVLRDPLTGAHSRGALQDRLREEVERARRYGLPLSLLIVDLDHFKSINDAFGHARGDQVLAGFAERVREISRESDLLFRYGGDEFVLLLLHTDAPQSVVFANRLQEGIRGTPFSGNPPLALTISVGCASYGEDSQTAEDLFERADRRLYEAKRRGRDRIVAEDPVATERPVFDLGARLLERDGPLATLRQFLDGLPRQKRGVLGVHGPHGVGKTWFLSEVVKAARLRGYAVWVVPGRPALRHRLFGALAESQLPAEGLPSPISGEADFLQRLQQFLREEGKAGLLLALDRAADLDRATLDLLHRVAYAPEIAVVGLAYTVDPDGPARLPLQDAPLRIQVPLQPLSALAVRLWLRGVLRWEAPESFAHWLHGETEGLPARLRLALEILVEHGVLRRHNDHWEADLSYANLRLRDRLQALTREPRHNLPVPATGFVGREAELAEVKQRLLSERLLAIVGSGGIGKTRLALQAAAEMVSEFPDGVYFIPLADVVSGDYVLPAIAQALGLAFTSGQAPRVQLLNFLRDRELLLILDAFEPVLDAAELLSEITQRAPRVKLLVTSRERLNLLDGAAYELRGMPIPPAAGSTRAASTGPHTYSAEQLFVQSARRVVPDFALSDEDRLYVRRICQVVDGMPLGIEMAAAWTPMFTCREIAEQIEHNLDFLSTSQADVPERQRSARVVLDYFWSHLAEDEQRRIRSLSVFRGGFERDAAQQVAEASLFFLSALVDKAFLRKLPSGRYEMHELLRQYAGAKLESLPAEHDRALDRHCGYYANFLHRQLEPLKGRHQAQALAAITADLGNIRAALHAAARHGHADAIRQSAPSLILYYETQNWHSEGAETFARAAEAWAAAPAEGPDAVPPETALAVLLVGHAAFSHRLGQNDQARSLLQHSLQLLRGCATETAYRADIAQALYYLGLVELDTGMAAEAQRLLRECLDLWRLAGDRFGMALALNDLAGAAYHRGDYGDARALYRESLELLQDVGDLHRAALVLANAGRVAVDVGDYGEAQRLLQAGAELAGQAGHPMARVYSLRSLGLLADARGEWSQARQYYNESLANYRQTGNQKEMALDLLGLAAVAAHTGAWADAQRLAEQSLAVLRQAGYRRGVAMALLTLAEVASARSNGTDDLARRRYRDALATALEIRAVPWALAALVGLAALLVRRGQPVLAAEVLTFALYHPASSRRTQDQAARCLSRLEGELPATEVAVAEERGRHYALDEVVAAVLGD